MCLQVLPELSASYASLVDVIGTSARLTFNNSEAERVHTLSKQWTKSMTHVFERNRYKKKTWARAVFVHLCHGTLCLKDVLPCWEKYLNHVPSGLFLTSEVLKAKLFTSAHKS